MRYAAPFNPEPPSALHLAPGQTYHGARLTAEAVCRPPLLWTPFQHDAMQAFFPMAEPNDAPRPFGSVRLESDGLRWGEYAPDGDLCARRGSLLDALSSIIFQYRISHYWQQPDAPACILCDMPGPGSPQYCPEEDTLNCLGIRSYAIDAETRIADNWLYDLLHRQSTADLNALLDNDPTARAADARHWANRTSGISSI